MTHTNSRTDSADNTQDWPDKALSGRKLRFAVLLASGLPTRRAYTLAGYSASRANRHGYKMAKEPSVVAFVAHAREALDMTRAEGREQAPEWPELLPYARALLRALVTGGLRETGVDPRLLRVELDAAREVILRAEGAVPQTVLAGDLAHMARIQHLSDAELEAFLAAGLDEQARLLGVQAVAEGCGVAAG